MTSGLLFFHGYPLSCLPVTKFSDACHRFNTTQPSKKTTSTLPCKGCLIRKHDGAIIPSSISCLSPERKKFLPQPYRSQTSSASSCVCLAVSAGRYDRSACLENDGGPAGGDGPSLLTVGQELIHRHHHHFLDRHHHRHHQNSSVA
eukprot:483315-Hanusia_phi.AAC.2